MTPKINPTELEMLLAYTDMRHRALAQHFGVTTPGLWKRLKDLGWATKRKPGKCSLCGEFQSAVDRRRY